MTDEQLTTIVETIKDLEFPDNWIVHNEANKLLQKILDKLESIEDLISDRIE